MKTLTVKDAQAIKPGDNPVPTHVKRLSLVPTQAKGVGRWSYRYTSPVTNKRHKVTLGVFPRMSLAEAFRIASEYNLSLEEGKDPIEANASILQQTQELEQQQETVQVQEQEEAKKNTVPTFEEAARRRYETAKKSFKSKRHEQNWIRMFEIHAFPRIGHIPVNDLEIEHFESVFSPLWIKKHATAKKLVSNCKSVMDECWARKEIVGNPVHLLKHVMPNFKYKAEKRPAIPWKNVPYFLINHVLDDGLVPVGSRMVLLFMILTAVRSNEARYATWDEFDLEKGIWKIPAKRMKAGEAHCVPLSQQAIRLLEVQKEITGWSDKNYVFQTDYGKPLSDASVSKFMRERDLPSTIDGKNAVPHGFRSSFRDWAADNEFDADTAERALAHGVGDKVQAAYERTDRFDARIKMMQDWADHVTSALTAYFGQRINDKENSTEELVANETNSDRSKILVAKTEKIIEEMGTNSKGVRTIKISTRRTFTEANKD